MSKKTCKDCLHCSIEGADEVYCSGMPWHYPFGGSDIVTLEKEACEHFIERDKPTLFSCVTSSPEVLAESVVYTYEMAIGGSMFRVYWTSPFIDNLYLDKSEAIAATVVKLKEVEK